MTRRYDMSKDGDITRLFRDIRKEVERVQKKVIRDMREGVGQVIGDAERKSGKIGESKISDRPDGFMVSMPEEVAKQIDVKKDFENVVRKIKKSTHR